jgi:hypothetical protein
MSDYDNTNRGALFKNNEKTEETHPDYRGRLNVDERRSVALGLAQDQQERHEIHVALGQAPEPRHRATDEQAREVCRQRLCSVRRCHTLLVQRLGDEREMHRMRRGQTASEISIG